MIFETSRYKTSHILKVLLPDGTYTLAIYPQRNDVIGPEILSYQTFVAVEGERFDLISHRVYGTPIYAWYLAHLNPQVFYPDNIPPGTILRIPSA